MISGCRASEARATAPVRRRGVGRRADDPVVAVPGAAGRRPGHPPAVHEVAVGLERRRAGASGHRDVVDEGAVELVDVVAHVGEGDPRRRSRRTGRGRRPSARSRCCRRWRRARRRSSRAACSHRRPWASGSAARNGCSLSQPGQESPVLRLVCPFRSGSVVHAAGAHAVRLDHEEVPLGLGPAVHPERERATARGDADRAGQPLVRRVRESREQELVAGAGSRDRLVECGVDGVGVAQATALVAVQVELTDVDGGEVRRHRVARLPGPRGRGPARSGDG